MRNTKKTVRRTAVVGGTVAALLGGGIAFAAWTATGTGSGAATATDSDHLTVTVGTASNLFPTGSVDVPFTVTNDNPYQVTLSVAHPSNIAVDSAHPDCNVASVTAGNVALTDVLAAGVTSAQHNVTLSMSNGANNYCKGATFSFDLAVTGVSSN